MKGKKNAMLAKEQVGVVKIPYWMFNLVMRDERIMTVLLTAPQIPSGISGFSRNPQESTGMRPESAGMRQEYTGMRQEYTGMRPEYTGRLDWSQAEFENAVYYQL